MSTQSRTESALEIFFLKRLHWRHKQILCDSLRARLIQLHHLYKNKVQIERFFTLSKYCLTEMLTVI